jgi:hypothetical protein
MKVGVGRQSNQPTEIGARKSLSRMVGRVGLELTTNGLRVADVRTLRHRTSASKTLCGPLLVPDSSALTFGHAFW